MARFALNEVAIQAPLSQFGPIRLAPGVPFTVTDRSSNPVSVYTTDTGGSAVDPSTLQTDSRGRVAPSGGGAWYVDPGRLILTFSPSGEPAWTAYLEAMIGGTNVATDASATVKGIAKLSVAPVVSTNPIAVGDNDPRLVGGALTPEFDPMNYGAVGDGTTNDWTAVNDAVVDWLASPMGGVLVFSKPHLLSPGSLQTPWRIPPNTDPEKWVAVRWEPGATSILTTNMPGLFQPNRTADGQTFRGIYFYNPTIDAGNVTTGENALFGPNNGAGGIGGLCQRINYQDIGIFGRFKVWNLAANGSGQPPKGAFALWIRHVYTNEGDLAWGAAPSGRGSLTQNTCTDIVIDAQVEIDGGDYGIAIAANLGRGETTGMRVKNFSSSTVINWVASKDVGGVDTPVTSQPALMVDDWIQIGTGKANERRKVTAVTDHGDGTGQLTIGASLTQTHPTEDANGADNGSPMTMGANCNVWFDRIYVNGRGGYIHTGTGGYSSNIFLVGHGIGNHIRCGGFLRLEGSNDNGVECDNALDFMGYDMHCVNARNQAFLSKNFNVPQDKNNNGPLDYIQVHRWHNCTQEFNTNTTSPGWYPGYNWRDGVKSAHGGASPKFGTIRLSGDCRVVDWSAQFRITDGAAVHAGPDCSFRRLELDLTYIKAQASDSAATTPKLVYLRPNTDCDIVGVVRVYLVGTATSGQPTFVDLAPYFPPGQSAGPNVRADLDIHGMSSLAGVANGGHHFFDFGNSASGSVLGDTHGRIGVKVLSGWTSSDVQPKCFNWAFNGINNAGRIGGEMVIDGCDTSRAPSGTVIHQFPSSSPSAGQRRIRHTRNNQFVGTFSNTSGVGQSLVLGGGFQEYDVTATGSPFTWINETTVECRLRIIGGVGTTIDFSDNSGSTWPGTNKILNQSLGPIPPTYMDLRPGEAIKLTYTTAPDTFAVFPLL
jgi:hypothetical protein